MIVNEYRTVAEFEYMVKNTDIMRGICLHFLVGAELVWMISTLPHRK